MTNVTKITLHALMLCAMGTGLMQAAYEGDYTSDPFQRVDSGRDQSMQELQGQRAKATFARARTEQDRPQATAQPSGIDSFANKGLNREEINQQQENYEMDTQEKARQLKMWNDRHWTTKISHWLDRFSDEKTAQQALRGNPDALRELKNTINGWRNDPDRAKKINDIRASVIRDLENNHKALDADAEKNAQFEKKIRSTQRVHSNNALEILKLLDVPHTATKIEFNTGNVRITTGHNTVLVYDGKTGADVTEQFTTPEQRNNPFVSSTPKSMSPEQFNIALQELRITTNTTNFATLTALKPTEKQQFIDQAKKIDSPETKQQFMQEFVNLTEDNKYATVKRSTADLLEEAYVEILARATNPKSNVQVLTPAQRELASQPKPVQHGVPVEVKPASDTTVQRAPRAERGQFGDDQSEVARLTSGTREAAPVDREISRSAQSAQPQDKFTRDLQKLEVSEKTISSPVLTSLDSASKDYLIQEAKLLDPKIRQKFVETFIKFLNDSRNTGIPTRELIDNAFRTTTFESLTGDSDDINPASVAPVVNRSLAPEQMTHEQFKTALKGLSIPEDTINTIPKDLDSESMQLLIDRAKTIDIPEIRQQFIARFVILAAEHPKNSPAQIIDQAHEQTLSEALEKSLNEKKARDELAKRARKQKEWDDANANNATMIKQLNTPTEPSNPFSTGATGQSQQAASLGGDFGVSGAPQHSTDSLFTTPTNNKNNDDDAARLRAMFGLDE